MSKHISRKDFLKGSAASAVGLATMGMLAGCSDTPATSETVALPGGLLEKEFEESNVIWKEIKASDISSTHDYDVVVVGAGATGVPAAYSALEENATVCVLQNSSVALSQGNMGSAVNLDKSDAQGIQGFLHMLNTKSQQRSNWKELQLYAEHSYEACNWLEEKCTALGFPPTVDEQVFEYAGGVCTTKILVFNTKPKNIGDSMIALADKAQEEGVDFYYNTPAVQLIKEDNRIVGVIGKDKEGNYIRFNAKKGVILTTGDYQNNAAMVEKYCPDLVSFDKKQVFKTGDGHLMGILAGGVMEPVGHCKMVHDSDSGPMHLLPIFSVNEDGKRFMNEEVSFENRNDVLRSQPRPGWYSVIFDNNYEEQFASFGAKATPKEVLEKYIPGFVENPTGVYESLIDTHRYDTLEELATALGIDPETFVASVERYNEMVDQGFDTDFGLDPKYLVPIKQAPFWGIHKHFRVSAICSGILVQPDGSVLDAEGQAIEGLYAAGNCAGQFYGGTDYPMDSKGLSLGRCYTFGRMVGKHVANL